MNRQPDIEGDFHLFGTTHSGRTKAVRSGYIPLHRLYDNYLSSGKHEYPDVEQLVPGEATRVLVWFISPEVYPGSLWVGREIDVMEGTSRVGGKLIIKKILNGVLAGSAEAYSPCWVEPSNASGT